MKYLLYVIPILLLVACGKTEQAVPASIQPGSPTVVASSVSRLEQSVPVKIKGLYLGMDIANVPNAMMEILAEQQLSDFSFTDPMLAEDGTQCVLMYTKPFLRAIESRMKERYGAARAQAKVNDEIMTSCLNSDGVMAVRSDKGNKVIRVEFNDARDIFNETELSPADFAKKLSVDFHIPEMKADESKTSWSYTGADGGRVVLELKEVLGISMLKLSMVKLAP